MIDAVPSAGFPLHVLGWPSGMRPMQIRIDGVVVADLWSLVRFNWWPALAIYSLPGSY